MAPSPSPTASSGLRFTEITDLGIAHGFDLQFAATNRSWMLHLCVGREDNRVQVTGSTPLSRQAAVLSAIDRFEKWGQEIDLWMIAESNGSLSAKTAPIKYRTHVKPFCGKLTISGIGADMPPMTYPGNGSGRLLSKSINSRYYFIYNGKLETDNRMRGFDCTSFPMSLMEIQRIAGPGYGKQLCEACNAAKCDLEQLSSADFTRRFKENSIPGGQYILFSAAHVMLYNSDMNVLHEFTYGGYKATPAAQRALPAPQGLWWMRKLDEKYRKYFF